jgi:uncharacterized protein YyaL (SSP411 family)
LNTLTLAHLTGDPRWRDRATRTIASVDGSLRAQGRSLPMMAVALATALAPPGQVVVVGPRDRQDTQALWRRAQRRFRPFSVMIPVDPGESQDALAGLLPWVGAMTMVDGRATAYVCENFVCAAPATDPEALP